MASVAVTRMCMSGQCCSKLPKKCSRACRRAGPSEAVLALREALLPRADGFASAVHERQAFRVSTYTIVVVARWVHTVNVGHKAIYIVQHQQALERVE